MSAFTAFRIPRKYARRSAVVQRLEREAGRGIVRGERPREEALRDLVSVETEVEEVFAAEPAAAPALQNGLGKRLSADGYDGRRVGAKRH